MGVYKIPKKQNKQIQNLSMMIMEEQQKHNYQSQIMGPVDSNSVTPGRVSSQIES